MQIGSWAHIESFCKENNMNEEDLVFIYDEIYQVTQSPGFKRSEVMCLFCDENYTFLNPPKENWRDKLKEVENKFNIKTKKEF